MRIALTAGLLLALGACPAMAAAPANPEATLVYYDAVSNQTLDPSEPQNNSSFSQGLLMAVYDSLIRLTPAGEPGPGLAESWSQNEDLTEFTLKLRHGVVFHDGAKFDAAAVKANFERNMALGSRDGAAVAETFGSVAEVATPDEYTVLMKLKAPNAQLPYFLGGTAGMMLSPAVLKDAAGELAFGSNVKPVGAGPYKVKSFESNVKTVATRFDGYWDGAAGRPATLEHHFVPESRARLNALRSGQANLALIDPRQIAEAKSAGLETQVNQKNSSWVIYVNLTRKHLGDVRVRQALMYAIDREGLAEALSFGSGKPSVQLFAETSPVFVPELEKRYPFDPKKARELLAAAGLKDGVELNFLLINTTEYRQLGEALQAMLAESGFRIKFDTVDASQYVLFRRPPGRGDIMMTRWGGRSDPLQVFQEIVGSGGSVNPSGVAAPEIDTLITKARGMVPTNPERMKTLRELNGVTIDTAATMPIMTRSNVYAYRPGCIRDLPPYLPTGNDRLNDVTIAQGCK